MKMNKWTVALAGLGLVSVTSAQAEEAKLVSMGTALSSTSIGGYVDTSAQWDIGTGNQHVAPFALNQNKQDGFNVDMVDVNISKPVDLSVPWSAGYKVDLLFGPDAPTINGNSLGNGLGENLRQAYAELSIPVGNYPTIKIGRWDNLLGAESIDSYKNYNWTRSYGFTLEPTEHTGILGHYVFTDSIVLDAGVADLASTSSINARSTRAESHKAYTGLLTLTAPKSWGFLAEDAVAAGVTYGQGSEFEDKTHVFVGGNLNTPLKDLKLGVAYDAVFNADAPGWGQIGTDNAGNAINGFSGSHDYGYATAIAGYATYSWTEKLRTSARIDYARGQVFGAVNGDPAQLGVVPGTAPVDKILALTGTISYDLWANVLTRLEVRWDHSYGAARPFGGTGAEGSATSIPTKKNSILVAANVVYKF